MKFIKVKENLTEEEASLRCPERLYFKTCLPNGHLIFTLYRDQAFLFDNEDPELKSLYKVIKKDFSSLGYHVSICKVYGDP